MWPPVPGEDSFVETRLAPQKDPGLKLLEHVVEIMAQTLKAEQLRRLTVEHQLARAYFVYGDTAQEAQAVKILEHVVNINSQTLQAEHLSRLKSEYLLAEVYLSYGI